MSHFKGKMHQIRFPPSVHPSVRPFVRSSVRPSVRWVWHLGAQVERRRREDRNAEGAEWVSPPHKGMSLGSGCAPPKKFYFDFCAQNGEFWCILGVTFCSGL